MRITVGELRVLIREGWFSSGKKSDDHDPVAKLAAYAGVPTEDAQKAIDDYAVDHNQQPYDWVSDDTGDAFGDIAAAAKRIGADNERRAWLEAVAQRWHVTVPAIERGLSNFSNLANDVKRAIASGMDPVVFARSDDGFEVEQAARRFMKAG